MFLALLLQLRNYWINIHIFSVHKYHSSHASSEIFCRIKEILQFFVSHRTENRFKITKSQIKLKLLKILSPLLKSNLFSAWQKAFSLKIEISMSFEYSKLRKSFHIEDYEGLWENKWIRKIKNCEWKIDQQKYLFEILNILNDSCLARNC